MDEIFRVEESFDFGLYLISRMDFEQGDIIFEESPLLSSPYRKPVDSPEEVSPYRCVTCCRKVGADKMCGRCGCPCCSVACSENENHKNFECNIFAKRKIVLTSSSFNKLMILRFLLCKKQNPDAYNRLVKLSSEFGVHDQTFERQMQKQARSALKFVAEKCKMDVKLEDVRKLLSIIDINSFGNVILEEGSFDYAGKSLYEMGSLFSHSCCPNMEYSFYGGENGGASTNIRFHARKSIRKGEVLTIAYVYRELLFGTIPRLLQIWESHHFICKCSRCLDATEGNTYFSAIKCPKCRKGNLLPEDVIGTISSAWQCDNCRCRKSQECVTLMVELVSERPLALTEMDSPTVESLEFADQFIDDVIGTFLHRNHYLIFHCVFHWLKFTCFTPHLVGRSKEAKRMFIKVMKRLRRFLPLAEKFLTSDFITHFHFKAASILAIYFFQSTDLKTVSAKQFHHRGKIRQCKRILSHLKLSKFWLSMAPTYDNYDTFSSFLDRRITTWSLRVEKRNTLLAENQEMAVESLPNLFL